MKISLKAARVNADMTLNEACKAIGVSYATLVRLEKNPQSVKAKHQQKISEVYKMPLECIRFQ